MCVKKIAYASGVFILLLNTAYSAEILNKDGNKLDLIGRLNLTHSLSDDESSNGDKSSYLRFGFLGETHINERLTGYGFWQYQYSMSNSEGTDSQSGNRTRLGYAGLKYGDLGSVDYGRNYGLMYDVFSYTDMLFFFGGDSAYADGFMAGRTTGVLTWRNKGFFGKIHGLDVALQYQGKNERTGMSDSVRRSNGDGYALSASYHLDSGISFSGAFMSQDRTETQNRVVYGRGDKAQNWAASVKYDANQIYIASIYGRSTNAAPITNGFANEATNFEVVAQYTFINGLKPSIGYVSSRGHDIEGIGSADLIKYVDIGMAYYFNKNMRVFSDYKINLINDNNQLGISSDNVVVAGITYQF